MCFYQNVWYVLSIWTHFYMVVTLLKTHTNILAASLYVTMLICYYTADVVRTLTWSKFQIKQSAKQQHNVFKKALLRHFVWSTYSLRSKHRCGCTLHNILVITYASLYVYIYYIKYFIVNVKIKNVSNTTDLIFTTVSPNSSVAMWQQNTNTNCNSARWNINKIL